MGAWPAALIRRVAMMLATMRVVAVMRCRPAIGCMSLMFASDVLAQSSCTIYGVDGWGLALSRQSGASDRVGAFRSGSVRPDFQKGNLRSPCLLWSKLPFKVANARTYTTPTSGAR